MSKEPERLFTQTLVNTKQIREEMIDGEPHIVVPASTLPVEGIVMNGVMYGTDVIINSYMQLEGTPAPLGHPDIDGVRTPAQDARAQNKYGVGAYNRNLHIENGVVRMEKVINKRIAESSERGRALLKAIYDEKPIHTSTGLSAVTREDKGIFNSKTYMKSVVKAQFDHDAFLIGEDGAATPNERVGVFVNDINTKEQVFDLNTGESLMSEESKQQTTVEEGVVERLGNALLKYFATNKAEETEKKEPTVESEGEKAKKESTETKKEGEGASEAKGKEEGESKDDKPKEKTVAEQVSEAITAAIPEIVDGLAAKLKELSDDEKASAKDSQETVTNSAKSAVVLVPSDSKAAHKGFCHVPD